VVEACETGNSSVWASGSDPGFITETVPLALLSVQRRVDLIEIEEFGDLSRRPSPHMVMEQMRFGKPLSEFDPDRRKNHLFGEYQPALTALAEFAGLTINRATVREPPDDCMALEASWRGGSVGMSADGHAYRQAHRCFLVQPGPWDKPT
jgi:hypothetical protein